MATTSAEAVPNSTHQTYRLGQAIGNRARDKIWNGDIVATASTQGFWEPDKEFKIKVKVDELKRKFHQSRYLQVKHLPRDVSESEIRQMLSDFPITSVVLSCGHGSAGSAKAYLEDPEMLEDWDKDRAFLLRGQKIPVSPTLTELVLCVARFPLTYSEAQFTGLVSSYGEVKMCFLMISEKTGESKGYGFVEYASKETALHAKTNLDGMLICDVNLCADFIDSTHTTFDSLHSKCLYVDNLPLNYRDMGEFRRKFSKVVNPPYCQIALKNGCPQNWGLVEFNTGEDAETTLTQLNGSELKDKKLRISYYIPGVRAINLYLKLLNETDSNRSKGNGLLPTPPPGVFQSFKNLQKQNPIFAQSIQNIMVTEQQLGAGNSSSNNQPGEEGKSSTKGQGPGPRKKGTGGPGSKSGPSSNASSESPGSEVPHDQQAAFLRLLAGQNPALLQSPQMASFLKQTKGALNGATVLVPPSALAAEASGLALPAAIPTGVPAIPVIPTLPDFAGSALDVVKPVPAPVSLIGVNPSLDAVAITSFPGSAQENGTALSMAATEQAAALWNSAAALSDIGEKAAVNGDKSLLGPHLTFARQVNPLAQRPQRLPTILPGAGHPLARGIIPIPAAMPPPATTETRPPTNGFYPWFPQPAVLDSSQFAFPPTIVPAASASADAGLSSLISQNPLLQYLGELNSGLVNDSINQYGGTLNSFPSYKQSSYKYTNGQANAGNDNSKTTYNNDDQLLSKKIKGGVEWNGKSIHSSPPLNNNMYRNGTTGSSHGKLSNGQTNGDSPESSTLEASGAARMPQSPIASHSASLPHAVWPAVGTLPHPAAAAAAALGQTPPRPIGFEAQILSKSNMRTTPPSYLTYQSATDWPSNLYASPLPANVTPVGQKRKYTRFLPSPEPSPEGSYIGQHSQGIGGHYIDSWPKRKKKN